MPQQRDRLDFERFAVRLDGLEGEPLRLLRRPEAKLTVVTLTGGRVASGRLDGGREPATGVAEAPRFVVMSFSPDARFGGQFSARALGVSVATFRIVYNIEYEIIFRVEFAGERSTVRPMTIAGKSDSARKNTGQIAKPQSRAAEPAPA